MKHNKIVIFLLLTAGWAFCNETIDQGILLQKEGQHTEAAEHFSQWLHAHIDHEDVPKVLSLYFDSVRDLSEAIETLNKLLKKCRSGENIHSILYYRAVAQEMSGDIAGAQQSFEFSNMRTASTEKLVNFFHSIRLLIETGELERAKAQTMAILTTSGNTELKRRAELYMAYIMYLQGSDNEGIGSVRSAFTELKEMRLSDIYLLYKVAELYKLNDMVSEISAYISALHGKSIEFREIEGSGYITIAPSLHYYQARDEGPVNAPTTEPGERVRIQTGIFSKRENADLLVTALREQGFNAAIEPVTRKTETLYRVVLPWITVEESQKYILELKEEGFEGFLLFQ